MNAAIGVEELNRLRSEFKVYLRRVNPSWSESTISTVASDAFFALNNNVGVDFWESLLDENSMLIVRDKIRDYLAITRVSDRPYERADAYLKTLGQLKEFLDKSHPDLAMEWKGKSISDVNLRAEFQAWMKKQKKTNGESYSEGTIAAYSTQIRNATKRLNLGTSVLSDLFYYTSYDEFELAHQKILAAPNFAEIDAAAGNRAYSNGMVLYSRFLKELGEPSAWIFQGNPKYYDVIGAVNNLEEIVWAVNQYPKQIKAGDKAYIWISGSNGGIVAAGRVVDNPKLVEPDLDDPYNQGDPLKSEAYLAVVIKINDRFTENKVERGLLLADERTKKLEILTFPGATNFRVTKRQEEVIESIIAGNYVRIPAVDDSPEEIRVKRRYWLYSPGEQARLWDELYRDGLMSITGLNFLGDLSEYADKRHINERMQEERDEERYFMNDVLATWDFANTIQIGDIVFAKRGKYKVIGRGVVKSEYIFDPTRDEYHHVHKVEWTNNQECDYPDEAPNKVLTDISSKTGVISILEDFFTGISGDVGSFVEEDSIELYSEEDFLSDVYISPEHYTIIKGLLLSKKNIILQGAPGVGKTFAAQRLVFSIMGKKDTSRVKVVQFHQSYSYEDFVMGYRPDASGFRLAEGPFYKFCKLAESDSDRPYFFIIDEINRGNMSKIFGELLMLIENDKRGEKNAIQLLYKDEQFSVPNNLHIIGMMNTADRSLAMIDYALRRRFAFINMEPAFQSDGFKTRQAVIQNLKFDKLVATVEALNKDIEEDASLGAGFRIGHSYFCTNDIINDAWISSVIEYEIIPLLNEYWFDEPSKVETWSVRLRGVLNG